MNTMNGFLVLTFFGLSVILGYADAYRIGIGRSDCTGPPVEIVFMGYANMNQRGEGLHLRQFARTFIIEEDNQRVMFINIDGAMVSHPIRRDVVKKLQERYGSMYTYDNVVISGTHTHGTPGGFMMHVLYDITTFGFISQTFNTLVDRIFDSAVQAHENMRNGRIFIDETEVLDANINRSPISYLNNPEQEKAQYKYDVDKTLVQLKFIDESDEIIGALNWFAVHPTSMNNTNHYVTTDNIGYASLLLESEMNPDSLPGQGKFIGAFAATNLGDVSPNIAGPKCEYTGESCDILTSSCPRGAGDCFASGPGRNMFESTKIIGTRIFQGALSILRSRNSREVRGAVKSIHQFVDMPQYRTRYFNPKTGRAEDVRGCLPAMGYSFAAGTTDGPGAFDFTQGTVTGNPFWNAVRNLLARPSSDDIRCQAPKPILLATGRSSFPYEWQPSIVPTQLLQIGDVIIAAVPGEFTTMSGRRLRNAVRSAILQSGGDDVQVIIAGLSNMYTSYIATPEEYEVQRYEAASTIFGPHTLTIYIDQYQKLVHSMVRNEPIEVGPYPPIFDERLISFQTPVIYDATPFGRRFGDVVAQPNVKYNVGETVSVRFLSGNPRNDILHGRTYLTIEKLNPDGRWKVVLTDANWDTKFKWTRTSTILGQSEVDIMWEIGNDTEIGTYRIQHFGSARHLIGGIRSYSGTSQSFEVTY